MGSAGLDRIARDLQAKSERVGLKDAFGLHSKQRLTVDAMYARPQAVVLAGGSGFGGKSYGLRFCAFHFAAWLATKGFTGRKLWFGSLSYESLRDRHMDYFATEYGEFGEVRSSDPTYGRCFRWHDRSMPVVCFRNLEDPNERRGSEFAGGFVDESTEFDRHRFGQVLYQIRSPGVPHTPVVAATNPDGVGHAWNKALWRPHLVGERWLEWLALPEEERYIGENDPRVWAPGFGRDADAFGRLDARDYIYVPYKPEDNPHFDEDRFWRSVAHLPEHVQRARRFGLWDSPEGARWPHLVEDRTLIDVSSRWRGGIPPHFEFGIAVDWGLRNPWCVGWWAIDPDTQDAYLVSAIYKAGVPTADQIATILSRTPNRRVDWFVGDPAMWQQRTDEHGRKYPSEAEIYNAALIGDKRFTCGFTEGPRGLKRDKLATLDLYLGYDNGWPDIYIDRSCLEVWSEFTGAVYATGSDLKNLSEELDPRVPDHAIDMTVYALHRRKVVRHVVDERRSATTAPEDAHKRMFEEFERRQRRRGIAG